MKSLIAEKSIFRNVFHIANHLFPDAVLKNFSLDEMFS